MYHRGQHNLIGSGVQFLGDFPQCSYPGFCMSSSLNQVAAGQIDVLTSKERLEAIRWLRRVSKHIRWITDHMSQAVLAIGQ